MKVFNYATKPVAKIRDVVITSYENDLRSIFRSLKIYVKDGTARTSQPYYTYQVSNCTVEQLEKIEEILNLESPTSCVVSITDEEISAIYADKEFVENELYDVA